MESLDHREPVLLEAGINISSWTSPWSRYPKGYQPSRWCRTLQSPLARKHDWLNNAASGCATAQQAGWYRGNSLSSLTGREGFLYP